MWFGEELTLMGNLLKVLFFFLFFFVVFLLDDQKHCDCYHMTENGLAVPELQLKTKKKETSLSSHFFFFSHHPPILHRFLSLIAPLCVSLCLSTPPFHFTPTNS